MKKYLFHVRIIIDKIYLSADKQIKKYIEAHYDEGTEITEEIKNKLFTMNELGEYFRKMIDPEWRGKNAI
ncbi:hypothetical protein I6I20_03690 [Lactococcus garvieae]|nr:hypothetical protein I6I20_03690 [Lactococcus garvieae]